MEPPGGDRSTVATGSGTTVSNAVPRTPPTVAEIVALPKVFPVSTPVLLFTETTAVLSEPHAGSAFGTCAPLMSNARAVATAVVLMSSVGAARFTSTREMCRLGSVLRSHATASNATAAAAAPIRAGAR